MDVSVLTELIPPIRYGIVNPGLYRGGYPTLRNFRFLSRLQLKTIISLIPEPQTEEIHSFAEMAGTNLIHIPIQRTTALNDGLLGALIQALNICIDANNHPVFIHCLDGRKISSLLVLLIRRIQGWSPIYSFSEYWRYQVSSHAPIPSVEVERVTKDLENFVSELAEVSAPDSIPKWLWEGDRSAAALGITLVAKPV